MSKKRANRMSNARNCYESLSPMNSHAGISNHLHDIDGAGIACPTLSPANDHSGAAHSQAGADANEA